MTATEPGVLDFVLLVLAVVVLPVLSARARPRMKRRLAAGQSLVPWYGRVLVRGAVVLALLAADWALARRPAAALGLSWPAGLRPWIALAIAGAILAVALVQLPKVFRTTGEKREILEARVRDMLIIPRTAREARWFRAVSVMAGIWEELLFRAFLIWLFALWLGLVGAVLASAAVFGLGHLYQGARGALRTGLIGLAFALLYVIGGTLLPGMALHATIDLISGAAGTRVLGARQPASGTEAGPA